jgi:formate hydrogenlyase subunit 3/multisubunit Na+/H+ antiporter MnhD subunit
MHLLLFATAVLVGSGAVGLVAGRRSRWGSRLNAAATIIGCAIGLIPALRVLTGAPPEALQAAWPVPYGAFDVAIDALSAFFLVPVLALSSLAALYGTEYLAADRETGRIGVAGFFFNLLVASMVFVVIARNAVLFLVAWELMALASFFLVTFEDDQTGVRDAGWVYLVATHLGTACLLALFVLLGGGGGSLDFNAVRGASVPSGLLFVLAVIGFGTKAGFVPFHIWLPEAHPAAPSHVSAVMSGVMIKTGLYGLIRILTLLGPPPLWWGWLLCAVGLTSGVFGVLFALAQHDLKRLLAYHSVENIGIIALGLGVGELGLSIGSAPLAVLGFAGALLHIVNHAIFKGLLFLGAGAVAHATGTREIDHLGGLLKRMPWTAGTFLVGAVAISGLPPLNGFVSEFLIYLGAFRGVVSGDTTVAVPLLGVLAGLALIGGLAAACFTKAFGIVFLGEPRSEDAVRAHECGLAMRAPMLFLAASCVVIGCLAPLVGRVLQQVVEGLSGLAPEAISGAVAAATQPLAFVSLAGVGLLLLTALLAGLRLWVLSGRPVEETGTWDCGYARPSPRMQYTASSYAQPLTALFGPLLQNREQLAPPEGLFPSDASLHTETPDVFARGLYGPVFAAVGRGLSALRWLQHGQVQLYVLYIALTLVALLVWKLG